MRISQAHGEPFSATTQSVVGGSATIVQAATTGRTYYITDLSAGAVQSTAVLTVLSSATNYWQDRVNGSVVVYHKEFENPLRISTGSAVTIRLVVGDTSGTIGSAFINVAGYFT